MTKLKALAYLANYQRKNGKSLLTDPGYFALWDAYTKPQGAFDWDAMDRAIDAIIEGTFEL